MRRLNSLCSLLLHGLQTAVLFLIALTFSIVSIAADAQTQETLRQEFAREYDHIARAVLNSDAHGLGKIGYSRDASDAPGRSSVAIEAGWRTAFATAHSHGPVTFQIESVTAGADSATVLVRRALFHRPKDAEEQFEESRSRDTWFRRDGAWHLKHREPLDGTTTGEIRNLAKLPQSPRLAELATRIRTGDSAAISQFWTEVQGKAPLIETIPGESGHRLVTFLWRGDEKTLNVQMRGGLPREEPKTFSRLESSDLWYWTERLPGDSRFIYSLWVTCKKERPDTPDRPAQEIVAITYPPDPLNPNSFNDGPVLELPDAPPQPWTMQNPAVPSGKVKVHELPSEILKERRTVTVYTPPGFDSGMKDLSVLILFDGEDYQTLIPTTVILDNLIAARRIPPVVAILVHSQGKRARDLRCSAPFVEFVVKELLPWARDRYAVSTDPRRVVAGGLSLGGLTAGYCVLLHPDKIGNVISQSGAFWSSPPNDKNPPAEDGWLAAQFVTALPQPVRFYIEVGRLESSAMIQNNRRIRDVLRARGYTVTYAEFNGGHDYVTWRGSLADALVSVLTPTDSL